MMRRLLLTILISACITTGIHAETVSLAEARRLASQFFNAAHGQMMAEPKMVYNGRRLTTNSLFNPFYIFNLPAGGYVIVSGDNKAFPILGYSLTDSFDPNRINEATKEWLRTYARDIEMIRYDSRVPYEAMEAWSNLPEYINDILESRYEATDVITLPGDEAWKIEKAAYSTGSDDLWSDLYSPDQWTSMMLEALRENGNVAMGIELPDNELITTIVHGNKGDMFRIDLGRHDSSLLRLFATEYLSSGKVAVFTDPIGVETPETTDVPFEFYDSYKAEDDASATRSIDLAAMEPSLEWHGSGLFTAHLPEPAKLARIYNLSGALARQYKYENTNSAHLDLLGEPSGFYFALIYGESGKPYGFKLVR